MTAHDWRPISDTYTAMQCTACGVIRIRHYSIHGTFTRYSRTHANIIHCNVWRADEPPCEATPEPITVTIRRAS